MANMIHCRFRNTLEDLQDCVEALQGEDYEIRPLSPEEMRAAKAMLRACQEYIDAFEGAFGDEAISLFTLGQLNEIEKFENNCKKNFLD